MPKYVRLTPWKNITDKLKPRVNSKSTLERFKDAAIDEPGVLPEDFGKYDHLPIDWKHYKITDDAKELKLAFTKWVNYLRNYHELVVITSTTNTETRLYFEPLKEYQQMLMRNDPAKYKTKFERRAGIISRTSTYNAEDAQELDDVRNGLIKAIETEDKKLKLKYGRKQVQ